MLNSGNKIYPKINHVKNQHYIWVHARCTQNSFRKWWSCTEHVFIIN